MSELESAIQTMVEVYTKCSRTGWWSSKEGIQKSKFKTMLQEELNHMLTNTNNKEAVKKLILDLNQNKDKVINFDEYWALIGAIIKPIAHNKKYEEKKAAESKGNK